MSTKNQTISNFPLIADVDANARIVGISVDNANIGNANITNATIGNFTIGNIDLSTIQLANGAQIKDTSGNAISFGNNAGTTGQGQNSIALGQGAGAFNQPDNSIVINATGDELNGDQANALYVDPIRNDVANTSTALYYNANTKEVTYGPSGGGSGAVFVTSNISAVVAGQPIVVVADFANLQYPGGVFTITQTGTPPVGNLTMSSIWASGGTSKNAYANFAADEINTQDISVTLTLSGSATFDVQSSDSIVIGTSTITGTDLLNLGITGSSDVITISSSLFANSVQTQSTTVLSASLTTSDGVKTANSNSLTTVQPTPFSVGNITGSFAISDEPFFNAEQSFSWAATNIVGTVTGGTVTLSGTHSEILTSSGATSGNSSSYDSSTGTFTLTGSYTGNGLNGAGISTSNVSGSVATATTYQPLFWKITQSNANPSFTTSDTYLTKQWIPNDNQGAQSTSTTNDRLWFAIPGPSSTSVNFKFDQPPFIGITLTKDANLTYLDQDIDGVTYQVYGFKDFSQSVFVYTTN
jgi:hypothetical protein